MSAQRISKTKKILGLISAIIDDSGALCSYRELHQRVRGHWAGRLGQAVNNLKRYGYLEVVETDNKKTIKLTPKGRIKALLPLSKKHKTWDGQWRLVAFDIEEKRKKTRDSLREALRTLGFKPLQKSLWITPYDVSESVEYIIDLLDIQKNVDYFITLAITNKSRLLTLFSLKK